MAGRGGYNTKTRQLILDYLINNRQHAVSASNILEHLEAEGASPNPTTVYRYLDKLAGEQRIMKYVADKGEKAVFQYVDEGRHCREHLHLKCVQCGRIYHLDCHFMDEVRAHLMAEHGFTLQCEGSVLYGLCRSCAQNAPIRGRPHKNANTVLTRTKSRDTMQAGKALIGKSKCSRFFCSECGPVEAAQRMSPERTPVSFPLNLLRAVSRGRRQPLVIAAVLSTGRVHKSDWCVRAPVI